MEPNILVIVLIVSGVLLLVALFTTVRQGTIAVVTVFGKFQRIMRPGLNIRVPLIEKIHSRISIQNQSEE
jgi:regulator of protease activity HflC (stomatin/prohibitin superfamily)